MKRVAILQSNYVPWKGYFDIINSVDLFVFHDDLQYTKNDWRNRNKIKTNAGLQWLTIPCGTDEKRLICEVNLKDHSWQKDHWNKISANYAKASYFKTYKPFFEELYLGTTWKNLSELNQSMIQKIAIELLGIKTAYLDSRELQLSTKKAERVKEILLKTGADYYLSGPAAKDYLEESFLAADGIALEWMDYSNYPVYTQLFPPFEHAVSIIDLIFNMGPDAKNYMKSFQA